MTHIETKRFWLAQDWTHQDVEIATWTGYTSSAVATARKRLGRPRSQSWHKYTLQHSRPAVRRAAGWDWGLPDSQIGRAKGISRQRVSQLRMILQKPKVYVHPGRRPRV